MQDNFINIFRLILASALGVFISQMIDLGIPLWSVLLALISGLLSSQFLLKRNYSIKKGILYHIALVISLELIFQLINNSIPKIESSPSLDLYPGVLYSQFQLFIFFYLLAYIENILFWTKQSTLPLEVLSAGTILLVLLSGHREYQIDMPNAISSLTWKLPLLQRYRIEPQELLVGIALVFSIVSLIYTTLASNRKIIGRKETIIQKGKTSRTLSLLVVLCVLSGLFYASQIILSRYGNDLSQVMNGVGPSSETKGGESNLGFNKASSPSKQPAALLRLLNAYEENPWGQMLYLRESALSAFNGKEMVKAPPHYDTDAPVINPGEPTYLNPNIDNPIRTSLKQAVYMLSEKISPFGIDAPTKFIPIKNPNPRRFRYAYTVQSQVVSSSLEALSDREVGEENWEKETWDHYLRAPGSNEFSELEELLSTLGVDSKPHKDEEPLLSSNNEDLRYISLARELTNGIHRPMKKVFSIIEYLSNESIYVLEPGHTVSQRGDPVAPYLFADKKRGYCVHYAHAATYLLRLVGIPARIGTGFLIDLQYAKGGDILVQMGDRHAWPEVYVRGIGWLAIDVTPAQAEDDQVAVPDESLLEELMSEIDPIEELLDKDPALESLKNDSKSPIEQLLDSAILHAFLKYILPALFCLFLLIKIFLRHGWRISRDPRRRLVRAYLGIISTFDDLALGRDYGETRVEYGRRLQNDKLGNIQEITHAFLETTLGNKLSSSNPEKLVHEALRPFLNSKKNRILYALSYLNPSSLRYFTISFKTLFKSIVLILSLNFLSVAHALPDLEGSTDEAPTSETSSKSAAQILEEGIALFKEGKGIDARAKFEEVLSLTPEDYRPYFYLGQYFLVEVGHFKLSYRYLKLARELFEKQHEIMGREFIADITLQNQHSLILYLVAEAALNLDFYEESLGVLDEYEKIYQSEWYPGQRAWVLMKLKRIEEAIQVAREGLLFGADPKRTWNILGILLSVSGQREMSLQAFARAVDYEFSITGIPQVATPLNNSGEVYRELFQDDYAESAWKTALRFPDGCEHVLPSINLSILYTDQLRIFQAEQILSDFEACYAKRPEKKDTEHRTILALARGKLKLFNNEVNESIELLERAAYDQQWFGKIGTNEGDVKFAAWISLAQTLYLRAESLRDFASDSTLERSKNVLLSYQDKISAWWLLRKARLFAIQKLDDFEDLSIRHTDTMLTYPMLGFLMETFDSASLNRRIERLLKTDKRKGAEQYYTYFLARKELRDGNYDSGRTTLESLLSELPTHERLLKAEILSILIQEARSRAYWWSKVESLTKNAKNIVELYLLSPAHLRLYSIPLPVSIEISKDIDTEISNKIKKSLLHRRFIHSDPEESRFRLTISSVKGKNYFIQLYDKGTNRKVTSEEISRDMNEGINNFIKKAFAHNEDPRPSISPSVPFMKKYGY